MIEKSIPVITPEVPSEQLDTTPTNAEVEQQLGGLVHYNRMCREIQHCVRVDEVKDIRDRAMALAVYAKQARNYDVERKATDIRIRAEVRAGELLREMAQKGERQKAGDNQQGSNKAELPPALAQLGISRKQSSDWQRVANIPETTRQAYLAQPQMPTTNGLLIFHDRQRQQERHSAQEQMAGVETRKSKTTTPAQAELARTFKLQKMAGFVHVSLTDFMKSWRPRWEHWKYKEHAGDIWDFPPSVFWSLLDAAQQAEVLRIAKALVPWLAAIIEQAEGRQGRGQ